MSVELIDLFNREPGLLVSDLLYLIDLNEGKERILLAGVHDVPIENLFVWWPLAVEHFIVHLDVVIGRFEHKLLARTFQRNGRGCTKFFGAPLDVAVELVNSEIVKSTALT
jgi:hypothetical protein